MFKKIYNGWGALTTGGCVFGASSTVGEFILIASGATTNPYAQIGILLGSWVIGGTTGIICCALSCYLKEEKPTPGIFFKKPEKEHLIENPIENPAYQAK